MIHSNPYPLNGFVTFIQINYLYIQSINMLNRMKFLNFKLNVRASTMVSPTPSLNTPSSVAQYTIALPLDTSPLTWAAAWGVGLLKPPPAHCMKLPCMRGMSNGWLVTVAIARMMRRRRGVLMFKDNVDFIQTSNTAGNMAYKIGVTPPRITQNFSLSVRC